jgi:hypothetical protein
MRALSGGQASHRVPKESKESEESTLTGRWTLWPLWELYGRGRPPPHRSATAPATRPVTFRCRRRACPDVNTPDSGTRRRRASARRFGRGRTEDPLGQGFDVGAEDLGEVEAQEGREPVPGVGFGVRLVGHGADRGGGVAGPGEPLERERPVPLVGLGAEELPEGGVGVVEQVAPGPVVEPAQRPGRRRPVGRRGGEHHGAAGPAPDPDAEVGVVARRDPDPGHHLVVGQVGRCRVRR